MDARKKTFFLWMNPPLTFTSSHRKPSSSTSPRWPIILSQVVAIFLCLAGLYGFSVSFFLAKRSLSQASTCGEAVTLLQQSQPHHPHRPHHHQQQQYESPFDLTDEEVEFLQGRKIHEAAIDRHSLNDESWLARPGQVPRSGCWMDRQVDSLLILVVDALRFDFAYYNLPESIGKRLHDNLHDSPDASSNQTKASKREANSFRRHHPSHQLFQFVADPPTVTMQRLKALTTGGLPTFADISANMGGASVEEDSWMDQMVQSDPAARGLKMGSTTHAAPPRGRMGFVGDDTWEDLFPGYFVESHPYPSFNTRDLDTVDNGCLKHIPTLLQHLRVPHHHHQRQNLPQRHDQNDDNSLEVVVVHFLGVDHVGHTYGPHNEHMDAKLKQMDVALASILDGLDASTDCHTALIFGDHGMTADGNHGGGTEAETHAALFVYSSPACAWSSPTRRGSSSTPWDAMDMESKTKSDLVEAAAFSSIHQIDLVPTISMLLGLPIPYANLGSLVPAILPHISLRQGTLALALNAAQVWRYLSVYSSTANRLSGLAALRDRLSLAVQMYREALAEDMKQSALGEEEMDEADERNLDIYLQAASLFKIFLTEALELGQRVWTRFDSFGMVTGISVLFVGMIVFAFPLLKSDETNTTAQRLPQAQYWEWIAAAVFIFFQCGLLTFSNSYILEEDNALMYGLAVVSILVTMRLQSDPVPSTSGWLVLLLPVAGRVHELAVSGHGTDPSIPVHLAHHSVIFLGSLLLLGIFRWYLYYQRLTLSLGHTLADCATLMSLAGSWWDKRSADPERNGYMLCRVALVLLFIGIPLSIYQALTGIMQHKAEGAKALNRTESALFTILCKVLVGVMAVTGPSTAASLVLYTIQAVVIYSLSRADGPLRVHWLVLAALWRMVTRHAFFATNHGCAFNRLQYSAAFIATKQFNFVTGGISLFLNTFGWEMTGLAFAWLLSQQRGRRKIWQVYTVFQILEAVASCISVSLLRRHLMVWDIYAPHFLFAAIFTILHLLSHLTAALLSCI